MVKGGLRGEKDEKKYWEPMFEKEINNLGIVTQETEETETGSENEKSDEKEEEEEEMKEEKEEEHEMGREKEEPQEFSIELLQQRLTAKEELIHKLQFEKEFQTTVIDNQESIFKKTLEEQITLKQQFQKKN